MTLDDFLDAIQDHRDTDHHQFKHPLEEIILVVLTGLLCGFDSYRSFAVSGRKRDVVGLG